MHPDIHVSQIVAAALEDGQPVVVLESIFQKLEKGMDRITAARVGTQEVITAVIAATLTSIIIFVPLVFGKVTEFSIWLGQAGAAIMLVPNTRASAKATLRILFCSSFELSGGGTGRSLHGFFLGEGPCAAHGETVRLISWRRQDAAKRSQNNHSPNTCALQH